MPQPTVLHGSNNYYVQGGSDRYFFELSELLSRRGHKVIPFCGASSQNQETPFALYFPPAVDTQSPQVTDIFRFHFSAAARRCIRVAINEQKPDIAHLHIYYGKLTASILEPLRERGIPVLQTLHEYKLLCPVYTCVRDGNICESCQGKHFWKALRHRCNRGSLLRSAISCSESYAYNILGATDKVDHFIGVSQFMTDKMLGIGIAADRITTIHNFVDCEKLQPSGEPGDYVLYFGRLEKTKGLYTLLEAMRMNANVRCIIAGHGPEAESLQQYAAHLGLENVEFPGFVSGAALKELIGGSLCTVLPSEWYENCPMSVLESLAYERAVIGARIGGIPELISHEEDGLIVEPADTEGLADALRQLAANPERTRQMGRAGREKVAAEFSPAKHYAKIKALYESLPGITPW